MIQYVDARDSGNSLNFIGTKIMEEFYHVHNQRLTADCLQQVSKEISMEFAVDHVLRKKLINKHEQLNKQLYNVNEAYARNPMNATQEIHLQTFFVSDSTEVYKIRINKVSGLSGAFQFPSVQKKQILLEFFGSDHLIHTMNEPIRIVTPPVKIKMDPLSSNRVNFNYYTYENIWKYEIDFEISNQSTIYLPYNSQVSCPSELMPKLSLNLLNFFKDNPNFVASINYSDDQQIKLDHANGTYLLRGFPLVEKLSSTEVKTVISDKDDL